MIIHKKGSNSIPVINHVALRDLYLSDDLSQAGVTEQEPAPGRDAIRLVLKLLGLNVVEVFKTSVEKQKQNLTLQ